MRKIVIFGNSGSGKSTLARELAGLEGLQHLDLDVLAWTDTIPPARKPLAESGAEIQAFIHANDGWVIEGCYTDLLELAVPFATDMVFLNLPVALCQRNARQRPWEPHKYASKAVQDANLEMLLHWISEYDTREDTFSKRAHVALYASFGGKKAMYLSNARDTR